MNKLLIVLAFSLVCAQVFAQKKTVIVGKVDVDSGVSTSWRATLKNQIYKGILSTGRLNVYDESSINGLSSDWTTELRQLDSAGVTSIVNAKLNSLTNNSTYNNDGSVTYTTKIGWTYTVTDVSDGSIRISNIVNSKGDSEKSYDESESDAFSSISYRMKEMVEDYFPLKGKIKALNETHPRKGVKTLYIDLGSDDGVITGLRFGVFKIVEIAGEEITEQIGILKVKEVKSGTLSLCSVSKGGKAIEEAYESELELVVVSGQSMSQSKVVSALNALDSTLGTTIEILDLLQ